MSVSLCVRNYFIGTVFTQLAQSGMLVLMPLMVMRVTGSAGIAGAVLTASGLGAAVGQVCAHHFSPCAPLSF